MIVPLNYGATSKLTKTHGIGAWIPGEEVPTHVHARRADVQARRAGPHAPRTCRLPARAGPPCRPPRPPRALAMQALCTPVPPTSRRWGHVPPWGPGNKRAHVPQVAWEETCPSLPCGPARSGAGTRVRRGCLPRVGG